MNPLGSSSLSFGQPQNTTTMNNNAFSFGQPSEGTGFSFGSSSQPATATVNPLTTTSGFSFGTGNSGGFSFGQSSNPASTTTSGGFNFFQNTSTPSGGFSLGQTNTTSAPSTAINFGQVPASSGFSFGQTNTPTSTSLGGFSFGQTNPVSSASSGGFSIGQPTSSSALNFGLSSSSNAPSGTLGQSSAGFSLGQLSNATNNPSSASGLFGQNANITASTAATGILGQTQALNSTNLFGQSSTANLTTTTATTTSSLFGQNTTLTSSGGLFGQTSSVSTPSGGLFGQTSGASTPSVGPFGQTSSTSTPSGGLFGQTSSTTTPSAGLNFSAGTGGLFGQTSNASTSTPSLNFAPSGTSGTGFSFASSAPSTTSGFSLSSGGASTGFSPASSTGLLGTPSSSIFSSNTTASSAPSFGLGGSLPTSSISTSEGLGGLQSSLVDSGIGSSTKNDGKSAKEAPLPQDIFSTIGVFESYKDLEKKCSEDNIRQTATPFHKLVEDTRKLKQHILKLSNQNNQLHTSAQKLKSAVIQEAENVEMARRTQDTPMNLQGDNKAPEQFFLRLVRSFEERMTFSRNRIEEVDKCIRSNGNVNEITSDDMKEALKKEHELVKVLAAKIYTLHNQLISFTNHLNNPDMQPEMLFRVPSDTQEPIGIASKYTSTVRPVLGEGGSGLLDFQNGQQKAKALSLGAAPPTLPLSQTNSLGLLGSANSSNIFGSSNQPLGSSLFKFNSGPNINNSTFGSSTPSFFGSPSSNLNQSGGLFGFGSNNNNSTTLFGNSKSFKK